MKYWGLLSLVVLVVPARAADSATCPIPGDRVHWIADYCMATLETDDEIAAMDCINRELERRFSDDCAAKRHYKKALCQLAVTREAISRSVESCLDDKDFVGPTVENGGVGG